MRILGAGRFWMDAAPIVEPLRFRRAPMLFAALCFALGDMLAKRWHTPLHLASATAVLLALAIISIAKYQRVAMWPVFVLWVAAGCWCGQIQPPNPPQRELAHYADGLSRMVRGRVVRERRLRVASSTRPAMQSAVEPWNLEPGEWELDNEPTMESVDLQVEVVEDVTPDVSVMRPVEGGVRIAITGGQPELHCGDVLEVPLRMRLPDVYRDPGAWSHADQLLGEGIGVQANVKAAQVRRIGGGAASWPCRFNAAQLWAAERIGGLASSPMNRHLPGVLRVGAEDAAMLQAMLFGDRAMLTKPLRTGFERTGTFHLFVVSGLHVAIVAGALFWILRKLRVPEVWAVLATILLTGAYAMLTGFGTPVQRAWLMSAAYLLALLFGRDRNALNALGAAALAVLVLDPRALFESSFQMTMLVIVAIAGLAAPLAERWLRAWQDATRELWIVRLDASLPPHTAQLRVRLRMWGSVFAGIFGKAARDLPQWALRAMHWLSAALLFGVCTELCMMLPMAIYFHRATLLALPVNAVCIPLVAVLLCAAVITFCFALISVKIAALPAAITALLLHAVRAVISHIGRAEISDLRVAMPAVMAVVLAVAAIAFCCWAFRESRRWVLVGAVVFALLPAVLLWPSRSQLHAGLLEVTALDVGQGDSLLVVSPDGHTLLVDAGGPVGRGPSSASPDDRWDVGEEVVAPYLWSRRIRRLDAVLLTHAHSDHMGGMPAILRDFHPHELWLSVTPGAAPGLQALLREAQELGVQVHWLRAGKTFTWNGLNAQVLSPDASYANYGTAANDDSLVMRLGYGKSSVLLEGDAEAKSEAAMLAHGLVSPSTLLKVGHHGSRTSTTQEFLSTVAPRDAVVSVGQHNTFGHPRFEVLQRLEAAGAKTYRTDRQGAETFLLTREGGISAISSAPN